MQHRIRAELQRALQVRRGERVVHDELGVRAQLGVGLLHRRRDAGDVSDGEQRIGRRLDPHDLRVRADRRAHRLDAAEVGHRVLHAPVAEHRVDQAVRSAVGVVRDHDVRARAQERPQQDVRRRHARRERAAEAGALQLRDGAFQRGGRRVGHARVLEPAAQDVDAVLGEGRAGVNGHVHRAVQRIRVVTGAHRGGVETALRVRDLVRRVVVGAVLGGVGLVGVGLGHCDLLRAREGGATHRGAAGHRVETPLVPVRARPCAIECTPLCP